MLKFEHIRERERWLITCSAKNDWGTQFFSAGAREFLLERRDIISYAFLGFLAKIKCSIFFFLGIKCSILSWLLVQTISYDIFVIFAITDNESYLSKFLKFKLLADEPLLICTKSIFHEADECH